MEENQTPVEETQTVDVDASESSEPVSPSSAPEAPVGDNPVEEAPAV